MEYVSGQPVEYEGPAGEYCTGHVAEIFYSPQGVKYIVETAYGRQVEAYGSDLKGI